MQHLVYNARYSVVDCVLKCDGTRAETRFCLSAQRTSPFKSVGGVSSVDYWQASCAHQSAGFVLLVQACVLQSRDAHWLPTPFYCFPFTSPPVRHRVPSHFNWTLPCQRNPDFHIHVSVQTSPPLLHTLSQFPPLHILIFHFLISLLILSPTYNSSHFPTKIPHAFLIAPIRVTCFAHLIANFTKFNQSPTGSSDGNADVSVKL
jgi:hypothetical protein